RKDAPVFSRFAPRRASPGVEDPYSLISIPNGRAVPQMVRKAASSLRALRSFIFTFTMSITCFFESLATFDLFGSLEPAAKPAAFFSSTEAGGDLVMKVNVLSL